MTPSATPITAKRLSGRPRSDPAPASPSATAAADCSLGRRVQADATTVSKPGKPAQGRAEMVVIGGRMAAPRSNDSRLGRLVPAAGWLPRYERRWLRGDLTAGVAVTALV